MRRVNLRLVIGLFVLLVVGGASLFGLHRFQVRRNAEATAALAEARIAAGEDDEAMELLSRYLSLRPDDAVRHRQYAEVLLRRAEAGALNARGIAAVKWEMEKAVRQAPEDDALRGKFATFLLRSGELSMARDHFAILLDHLGAGGDRPKPADGAEADDADDELDPRRIALLFAATAAETGRFDEAEEVLGKLVGFDPRAKSFAGDSAPDPAVAAAFPALAQIEEKHRRDPKTAAAIIDRLAQTLPDDANAWKMLAAWHIDHRSMDAADAAAAKARALSEDDTDSAYLDLQAALLRKDDDRAEAILAGPLAGAPATVPLVVARSTLLQRRGDTDGRIAVLREALDSQPENRVFLAELILALVEGRRIDDLKKTLETSRAALPRDAEVVLYADAAIAMEEQRWLPALRFLERLRPLVAADDAFTRRVDVALSTCHAALGQLDQAADARSRAFGAVPGSTAARFAEMQTLEQTGRPAEALVLAEAIAEEIGPERLPRIRELWLPLFRLRFLEQIRRDDGERDWSSLDALLDGAVSAGSIDPDTISRLRVDLVAAREGLEAGLAASERAIEDEAEAPALLAQRVMLLAGAGRVDEARALVDGMTEEVRDSADVIEAEVRLAAVSRPDESAAWLADVESRLARLEGPDADRVAKQLIAIHFGRGSAEEAERVARESVARSPDHLPVHIVLLDLAAERDDVEEVEKQSAAIARIAGETSPNARVADALGRIVRVRAARARRLAGDPTDGRLRDDERAALDFARGLLVQAGGERPRWADIPRHLAAIAELQGDFGGAIGYLRQASELGESLPFGRRRLALLLAAVDRLEEAVPVIQSLGDAGGPAIDRLKAEAMVRAGQVPTALALAATLVPEDCRDPARLQWHAELLARCGRAEEAERACRRAIEASPGTPGPWATLVKVRLATSRALAKEAGAEALANLSGDARKRFETLVSSAIGDPEATENERRAAVAAAPDDVEASRRLIETLLARQKDGPAREELRRLIALDSAAGTETLTWARRTLAVRNASTGDYRDFLEAIGLLEKNVDAEGRQLPEDTALAIAMLVGREEPASWRQALPLFERLAAARPLSVDERANLARIHSRLGPRVKAREELTTIASSANTSIPVVTTLVDLLVEDGDLEEARRWIERLGKLVPDSPTTIRLEARLALARGDRDGATRILERLLPSDPVTPDNVNRLMAAAAIADQLGFAEMSERVYAEAGEFTPSASLALGRSLGRRHRTSEAIAAIAPVRDRVSPLAFLDALAAIARYATAELPPDDLALVEQWVAKARRENPGAAGVSIQAAILEDAIGKTDAAELAYRDLLAGGKLSAVESGIVSANLAWILARPETAAEANTLADRAVQVIGPLPDILDTRALARLARGQTTLAMDDMRDAVIVPTALKFLHLATIQAELSDTAGARTSFERSKSLGLLDERLSADDKRRLEHLETVLGAGAGES